MGAVRLRALHQRLRLDIAVKDGRIVGVRGRADDRVNHGRLGPKGLYGGRRGRRRRTGSPAR